MEQGVNWPGSSWSACFRARAADCPGQRRWIRLEHRVDRPGVTEVGHPRLPRFLDSAAAARAKMYGGIEARVRSFWGASLVRCSTPPRSHQRDQSVSDEELALRSELTSTLRRIGARNPLHVDFKRKLVGKRVVDRTPDVRDRPEPARAVTFA